MKINFYDVFRKGTNIYDMRNPPGVPKSPRRWNVQVRGGPRLESICGEQYTKTLAGAFWYAWASSRTSKGIKP